jgi:hypothetical protein
MKPSIHRTMVVEDDDDDGNGRDDGDKEEGIFKI